MIKLTKNGDILYYESYFRTFFRSSISAVLEAEYSMNRNFAMNEKDSSMALFYKYLDLEPPEGSEDVGWDYDYMCNDWNTYWIDFVHRPKLRDDTGEPYVSIEYPIQPTKMYERLYSELEQQKEEIDWDNVPF